MQYPSMAVAPGVGSGPSTWCGSRYDCTYNNGGGIYTYIIVYTVCIYIYTYAYIPTQFPILFPWYSHRNPPIFTSNPIKSH
jgi:hypothetical protein